MKKPYLVFWSPQAEKTYLDTLQFILQQWTIKEAEEFESMVDRLLLNLSYNKNLCPRSISQKHLRRCVVSPQTSLVYSIENEEIELVAFLDNRSKHKVLLAFVFCYITG